MKRFVLLALLVASCQSTSSSDQESAQGTASWLFMRNSRIEEAQAARTLQSSPDIDPILKAAQDLQWDRVKVLADAHLQKYPGNKDALLLLSLAHAGLGDNERARFFAELVLKGHPGTAFALNILGLLKRNAALLPEDHRQALVYFQLAQQADPKSAVGSLNAAYLNLELGHFREARNDFKQALSKCGDCSEARIGSALANQALGQFDEAKIDIEAVLSRDENQPIAQLLRATQTLYIRKEYEEGRKVLTALLENGQSGSELQKEVRTILNRLNEVAH
jgi:tetratricopeptide (TPR) repeat protein